MGSNLAPDVEIIERSFSQRIEAGALTKFATLGLFTKGPVNEATKINSPAELQEVFGTPSNYTYKYFYPISTMLEQAPVEVVRIEESTLRCSAFTVGVSGSAGLQTPETSIAVAAYPLTYDSLYTPDDDNVTQIDLDALGLQSSITVASVGPGTYYNDISVAMVNATDYAYLQDLQLALSEANTPADVTAVGQTTYNIALSGGGLDSALAEELIDPSNSYDVDEELLDAYLSFERGPTGDTQFGIYEFEGSSLVGSYLVSVDPAEKDAYAKSMFANKVIAEGSINIDVFVGSSKLTADAVTPPSLPRTSLSGASALSTDASTLTDEFYQQLNNNFYSKEEIEFTALVDLDFPVAIKQRMDQIAQVRQDCVALLNVDASRMINTATGAKTNNQTTLVKQWTDSTLKINSSYSALYANYFQVYDYFNDENRWIPCTGHVANRLAYTFENFEPWFAVAGLERRGIISGVLKVAYNPNDAQRKVIYPARINPVVDFRGEGVVIWGQKTLLSVASSLDRLNVRNLLIYIEKALERFSRNTLFKQNDEFTRAEWRANVGPFLNSIVQRRGLLDYKVVCDESNNTPDVVARNEFQAYVLVKPTPVAEFIKIVVAEVGGNLTFDEVLNGVNS